MPVSRADALEQSREQPEGGWESPGLSSALFVEERFRQYPQPKQLRHHQPQRRYLSSRAWRVSAKTLGRARASIIERSNAEVLRLFGELTEQWREESMFEADVERIVLHPSYQRIIGLGPQVVPYILQELERSPDHWFWALRAIIGEDKALGQTSIGAAAEAWLAWGRDAGIADR